MFTRLFSFLLFFPLVVVAAPGQPVAAGEAAGVEISLVGLGDLPAAVKVADGRGTLDIGVPASGRGASFRYRGASPLVFFREMTDAEGQIRRVPIATVEYPAGWKKMLIVLISGGHTGEDWRFDAQAFDDSAEGFPAGHARVFNFYQTTLALNNGGEVAQVPPRQSRLVALRGAGKRVWMKMAVQRAAEWETLPAFVTQVAPDSRLLVFAYEAPGDAGRIERTYRSISEVVVTSTVATLY